MRTVAALLSLSLAACATATQSKEPVEQIPVSWIDLPESPFVARTVGRKTILVNRSQQTYTFVSTGCVVNDAGKVKVLWELFASHIFDSSWKPADHVEGLLRMVERIDYYVANQGRFIGRDDVIKRCPPDASTALTSASGPGGLWQAQGTAWPRRD